MNGSSSFWDCLTQLAAALEKNGNTKRERRMSAVTAFCLLDEARRSEAMHALSVLLRELPELSQSVVSARRNASFGRAERSLTADATRGNAARALQNAVH
jgi:hypothetical protein